MLEQIQLLANSPLKYLIPPAGLVAAFLVLWWRAGSNHIIADRLWTVVSGKMAPHHPKLKKLIEETHDLEQFRFRYRLRVLNTRAMERLIDWMNDNSVGVLEIQRCRDFVDYETKEILSIPSKALKYFVGGLGSLVGFVFIIFFSLAAGTTALATNKQTGHTFQLGKDFAERFSILDFEHVTRADCKALADGDANSKKSENAAEICLFMNDPRYDEYVKNSLHDQRIIGATLGSSLSPLLGILFFQFRAIQNATRLYKRVNAASLAPEKRGKLVSYLMGLWHRFRPPARVKS